MPTIASDGYQLPDRDVNARENERLVRNIMRFARTGVSPGQVEHATTDANVLQDLLAQATPQLSERERMAIGLVFGREVAEILVKLGAAAAAFADGRTERRRAS